MSIIVALYWALFIVGFVYLYSNYETIKKSDKSPFSDITHSED
jgi:hypothetical protein